MLAQWNGRFKLFKQMITQAKQMVGFIKIKERQELQSLINWLAISSTSTAVNGFRDSRVVESNSDELMIGQPTVAKIVSKDSSEVKLDLNINLPIRDV